MFPAFDQEQIFNILFLARSTRKELAPRPYIRIMLEHARIRFLFRLKTWE